ncbi:helix-turn-helix transcriptional regulator [Epilithonimonas xixisoli]|uniref:HTH luxR-type domain-containing protein n=1 Tax=Epilithonimonas xixisoli TaxID=1476462 RepID=A0A4R8IJB3_9FLAO|nr:hypothetical protein [Epilithonimonas xixisoli]TDX86945.1 hypothetical protein B0I22_1108 [Epilithonimonas xixisoli]
MMKLLFTFIFFSANGRYIQNMQEISFFKESNVLIIFSILLSSILLVIIINARLKRKNTIKKKALQDAERELIRKQEIILQRELEKKELEHKINDAFEEVLQLAKTNNPAFLARFKEVYPEFYQNLLSQYPQLLNSEMTFCAYLKLNLTSKEIASYTFVTHKAIELRKNRFRKKMNISSEENLYIWIDKF